MNAKRSHRNYVIALWVSASSSLWAILFLSTFSKLMACSTNFHIIRHSSDSSFFSFKHSSQIFSQAYNWIARLLSLGITFVIPLKTWLTYSELRSTMAEASKFFRSLMNVAERSVDLRASFALLSLCIVLMRAIMDWDNLTAGLSSLQINVVFCIFSSISNLINYRFG